MIELETAADLHEYLRDARRMSKSVGLVPTMGSLHDGHGALVDRALGECDVVALSVYVNPLQFNDPSDYERYPRDPKGDSSFAEHHGVSVLYRPPSTEWYPAGTPQLTVDPGPLAGLLEGASRPGHFRGVATIVAKLLASFAPDRAYFGEKDYQQLAIVRQLAVDLSFPVEIVGCETVRESDGCALSSRNLRLSPAERQAASVLYRALVLGRELVRAGEEMPQTVESAMAAMIATEPLANLDYAVIRDARNLEPLDRCSGSMRLLMAANFGEVRLIDNVGVTK